MKKKLFFLKILKYYIQKISLSPKQPSVYVSLQLSMQNAVSAQPCVGKVGDISGPT